MKIKRSLRIMVGICFILIFAVLPILAACGEEAPAPAPVAPAPAPTPAPAAPAAPETIELKYQYYAMPPPSGEALLHEWWGKEIEKRTNGKVKIDYYWSGSLAAPPDSLHAIQTGIVDIVTFPEAIFPGDFPIADLSNWAFVVPNASACGNWLFELNARGLLKEFDPYKVVYYIPTNPLYLYTNKRVASLEDIKGMKIRAMGTYGELIKALGGSPVSVVTAEVYMALERGVVDGVTTVMALYLDAKLHEITKYTVRDPLAGGLMLCLMNRDVWEKIPAEYQVIMNEVSVDQYHLRLASIWEDEVRAWEIANSEGREVVKLSTDELARWKKATEPIIDKWESDMNAKGLPGTEAVEIAKNVMARHSID